MKKKGMILGIIIILFAVLIIVLIPKNKNVYAVYENGQMGIITSKFKDPILVENQEKEVYHTYSDSVYLNYESYNLDNAYGNTLVINEKKEFPFKADSVQYGVFLKNEFLFLGLNIVNGKLEIAINSGKNYGENYNTFFLRNIYLVIEDVEIWSNEYPKDECLNQNINFGEDDMNEEVRSNYQKSVTFSFDIPDSLLDSFGVLLEDVYHQDTLDLQVEGKEYTIKNESKIDFECNIENDEIITQTKTLAITSLDNEVTISVFMDGIEIRPDLRFTENAWADGDHQLKIVCRNKYNFIKTEVIDFRLETSSSYGNDFNYQIYQTGVSAELPQGIDNLGVLIGDEVDSSLHEIDEDYLITPFGPFPVINIVIEKNNQTAFNWLGYVNQGRTAFMQIYNHQQELWETVSTKLSNDDELIKLGFDYQGRLEYEKENLIYLRVASKVNNISESRITNKIFHATDFQYITRLLAASEIGSANYRQALAALQSMTDYFIDQYQNNHLEYLCLTGDFVQQQKGGGRRKTFGIRMIGHTDRVGHFGIVSEEQLPVAKTSPRAHY
ncbi:MAG: hypothetical protein PHX62_04880, partial [Bacilli bacterium]|nr:hypothetical protein [Bacilli bacterium]